MLSQSSPDYDSATAPASRSYSKDGSSPSKRPPLSLLPPPLAGVHSVPTASSHVSLQTYKQYTKSSALPPSSRVNTPSDASGAPTRRFCASRISTPPTIASTFACSSISAEAAVSRTSLAHFFGFVFPSAMWVCPDETNRRTHRKMDTTRRP